VTPESKAEEKSKISLSTTEQCQSPSDVDETFLSDSLSMTLSLSPDEEDHRCASSKEELHVTTPQHHDKTIETRLAYLASLAEEGRLQTTKALAAEMRVREETYQAMREHTRQAEMRRTAQLEAQQRHMERVLKRLSESHAHQIKRITDLLEEKRAKAQDIEVQQRAALEATQKSADAILRAIEFSGLPQRGVRKVEKVEPTAEDEARSEACSSPVTMKPTVSPVRPARNEERKSDAATSSGEGTLESLRKEMRRRAQEMVDEQRRKAERFRKEIMDFEPVVLTKERNIFSVPMSVTTQRKAQPCDER
jgi:hypothetical protein